MLGCMAEVKTTVIIVRTVWGYHYSITTCLAASCDLPDVLRTYRSCRLIRQGNLDSMATGIDTGPIGETTSISDICNVAKVAYSPMLT